VQVQRGAVLGKAASRFRGSLAVRHQWIGPFHASPLFDQVGPHARAHDRDIGRDEQIAARAGRQQVVELDAHRLVFGGHDRGPQVVGLRHAKSLHPIDQDGRLSAVEVRISQRIVIARDHSGLELHVAAQQRRGQVGVHLLPVLHEPDLVVVGSRLLRRGRCRRHKGIARGVRNCHREELAQVVGTARAQPGQPIHELADAAADGGRAGVDDSLDRVDAAGRERRVRRNAERDVGALRGRSTCGIVQAVRRGRSIVVGDAATVVSDQIARLHGERCWERCAQQTGGARGHAHRTAVKDNRKLPGRGRGPEDIGIERITRGQILGPGLELHQISRGQRVLGMDDENVRCGVGGQGARDWFIPHGGSGRYACNRRIRAVGIVRMAEIARRIAGRRSHRGQCRRLRAAGLGNDQSLCCREVGSSLPLCLRDSPVFPFFGLLCLFRIVGDLGPSVRVLHLRSDGRAS